MFVKICLILLLFSYLVSTEPLELTDKTWKDMLSGQWMVEFYAPWCSACQRFKSTWNGFAKAMIVKDIKVAAIDVTQYPSLSGRFRISTLPTIYYVRHGVFRQFNGEYSLNGLKTYIGFRDWQQTEPVSSLLAPDSILMSLSNSILDLAIFAKKSYSFLEDNYGWPTWFIYLIFAIGVITLGLLVGSIVFMIIDYCAAGRSKVVTNTVSEESEEGDKQRITTDTSSTGIDENQDEELNISDDVPEITTDTTVRQRQLNK